MNHKLTKQLIPLLIITGILIFPVFNATASDKTGRPVRITSLCFEKADFREILRLIDEEGAKGTDVIVLPETWRGDKFVETPGGETITELSRLAEKHKTYIISPIELREGVHRYNSAVLLGRDGSIIGSYDKLFPYWSEFDLVPPVEPGRESPPVFETDFGKIGMAICFDANFPEVWQTLRDKGAEIVFWPSAYSAGSQLQAYALLHHYYIVTSTYSRDCQVFDITGQKIIDETSNRITVARMTLDLDRGIYHENFNMDKLERLIKVHGDEIEKEITMPREQLFVLKAVMPQKGSNIRVLEYEKPLKWEYDSKDGLKIAIPGSLQNDSERQSALGWCFKIKV